MNSNKRELKDCGYPNKCAKIELPTCSIANTFDNEQTETGSSSPVADKGPPDGNQGVVAQHYNNLRETGLHTRNQSNILYMRNFNNWIKSMIINEFMERIRSEHIRGESVRVMDMCCGKGGDLLKWSKANITHLICTDIAEVSVEQCKNRFEVMNNNRRDRYAHKFTAEFFVADATLVRLRERFSDPSLKLNLVSCQFAFHYSFESLSQAKCMIRNAAECLQAGGYFIATIPNANEIMRRLRASKDGKSFGNRVYNIEFLCDTNPPPLFGAKYKFHLEGVVDCPEFLVHFPTFVKLCRKYGLQLEKNTPFVDFYKENAEKGKDLLRIIRCLETVDIEQVKNNAEYAHVLDSRRSGYDQPKTVETLSTSEWEAISIYSVCAFRKVKNTWDSEGKPVYEFADEKHDLIPTEK